MASGDDAAGASWIGAYDEAIIDGPLSERYTLAIYWALMTLTTVGYGDIGRQSGNVQIRWYAVRWWAVR